MKKTITIEVNEPELKMAGQKLLVEPELEEKIAELLELQAKLNDFVEEVKQMVADFGTKADPTFKGFKGEKISFAYRFYGGRFAIDPSFEDKIPSNMVEKKIRYSLKPKEVEQYLKEVGELPLGVIERERSKTPSLKLIEVKNEN